MVGIVKRISASASIKKPRTRYINRIIVITANAGNARFAAQFARAKGSLLTAMNLPNTTAPDTRSMIIEAVFTVAFNDFLIPSQFICFLNNVINNILAVPIEPASVGVNQPAKRPPREIQKVNITSIKPFWRPENLSLQVKRSPAGPKEGFFLTTKYIANIYESIKRMPGMIPARNNEPIDCSVCIPYTIKITLGGISTPNAPPAATLAEDKESSYLYLRISGSAIAPIVAAVAVFDPQIAPKMAHAS